MMWLICFRDYSMTDFWNKFDIMVCGQYIKEVKDSIVKLSPTPTPIFMPCSRFVIHFLCTINIQCFDMYIKYFGGSLIRYKVL